MRGFGFGVVVPGRHKFRVESEAPEAMRRCVVCSGRMAHSRKTETCSRACGSHLAYLSARGLQPDGKWDVSERTTLEHQHQKAQSRKAKQS
jgi:hypothetical protein